MIDLRNIKKSYREKDVLDDVYIKLNDPSKMHILTGDSGSGKTTLFNILMGLDKDYFGEYTLLGKSAEKITNDEWASIREYDMRMVYQDYKLLKHLTVYDNIDLSGDYSEKEIDQILKELDIHELKSNYIHELSGGQMQRVSIARAVISKPRILLMDEPTGNLDSIATQRVMSYLNKLKDRGVLVFIVTHDEQVLRYGDIVYEINNNHITLVKSQLTDDIGEMNCENKSSSKKKISQYVLKSLKKEKKKHSLLAIPTVMIITLFILCFSAFRSSTTQSFAGFFAGVGDRAIVLDTQSLKQEVQDQYKKEGIVSSIDGERIAFSEKDVNKVDKIEHVEEVYLFSDGVQTHYDNEKMRLNESVYRSELPKWVEQPAVPGETDQRLTFHFSALQLPSKYLVQYNTENIKLIAGKFPSESSNEILIPDIYALLNQKDNDFQNIVGDRIELSVLDSEDNQIKNHYVISGVYRTEYRVELQREYPIYTNHNRDNTVNETNKQDYQFLENTFIETPESEKFHQNVIGDYEDFKRAYGTGFTSMYVQLDDTANAEVVSDRLEDIFPAYRFTSQYELKHGDFSKMYSRLVWILFIGSVTIALLAGTIITFLNKGQINNRSYELAVLYSLGYRKKDILKIIALENGLLFSFYFSVSLLIAYLSDKFILSTSLYYEWFENLFSISNISLISLLIFLISAISVLWGLNGVKQTNLIKHLND
ncbi:MAG: ABC transporter ATP-binding protein/permease [Mammaliicoccus vitulinus]